MILNFIYCEHDGTSIPWSKFDVDHCDEDHDHAQDDDHDEEGLLQGVLGRSWGPLVRLLQLSSATLKPPRSVPARSKKYSALDISIFRGRL